MSSHLLSLFGRRQYYSDFFFLEQFETIYEHNNTQKMKNEKPYLPNIYALNI